MIKSVHHIAIIVSSEESLEFYRTLGFHETFRINRDYDTVVLMDNGSVELNIFIDSAHPSHPVDKNLPIGVRHFALKVDSLDNEIERLKSDGINVDNISLDWRGQRYCFINDYDGITVELHE